MLSTYQFRILQSSWGIAIDITAGVTTDERYELDSELINDHLRLGIEVSHLNETERRFIRQGLKSVSDKIRENRSENENIVIRITGVEFNPTDYQPEGLYYAIIGWAARIFEFPEPKVSANFDKENNKYLFNI